MIAHGLAGGVIIAGGDCIIDAPMFTQDHLHIGFLVFGLWRAAAKLRARNGLVAQMFEKFGIAAVIGGRGNRAVEFEIGRGGGFPFFQGTFHFFHCFENLGLLGDGAAHTGKTGGLDFDGHTQFKNFQNVRYLGVIDFENRFVIASGFRGQNKHTGPLTGFKKPVGLKGGDGFANDGAADAEPLCQNRFGWQFAARFALSAFNFGTQACNHLFGQGNFAGRI